MKRRRLNPMSLHRAISGLLPAWFATTMGTGIASILLRTMPYQIDGQHTIANVIFAFNTVLFVILFGLFIARCLKHPTLVGAMLVHPVQPLFIGTLPQGFATIITMIVYSIVPVFPSAHAFLVGMTEAFWWLNAVTSTVIAIGAIWLQVRRHPFASLADLGPFLFLSIAATVISAATGSTVASVLDAKHAWNVALASYVVLGTGLPICLGFMSIHLLRTTAHGLPNKLAIISMFLPLGPCGQGGLALLQLAKILQTVAASPSPPKAGVLFSTVPAIHGFSIIAALGLWGLGLFWFCAAVSGIIHTIKQTGLRFNIGYWGCTFPIGAWTTSTLALGEHLDSHAFRILGTILALLVVLLVLIMWTCTGWALAFGDIYGTAAKLPSSDQPQACDEQDVIRSDDVEEPYNEAGVDALPVHAHKR